MNRSLKNKNEQSPLSAALRQIELENTSILGKQEEKHEIVDIMEFCDSPEYLNLPGANLNLFIGQRVILKCFYKGAIGNENLRLTEEEWEWLYERQDKLVLDGEEYDRNIKDVIEKMKKREADPDIPPFSQLVLVLGRRASKTLMASIITVYEAYKVIVINNYDPHSYYNLPDDDEIAIINMALSLKQAGRLFEQIKSRLRNAKFFQKYIANSTSDTVRLYTRNDLLKKEKQEKDGVTNLTVAGSILLLCGHSNPDTLAGYNTILLLFDEIAFYEETGKLTGKYFVTRLKPSLSKFYKYNAGKLVMISSPNAKSGVFYESFNDAMHENPVISNSSLSFQLPTWDINTDVPYDEPELAKDRSSDLDRFKIEFGAQWAFRGTYGKYFEPELVEFCISSDISAHEVRKQGINYYMHVDPAKKNNNYAAVMVARERYINAYGQKRNRCYLAGVWVWRPVPGVGIDFEAVDLEVIQICRKFRPYSVTYDDYQSVHSIQRLRNNGINCSHIPYNNRVKCKIYRNLKNLMTCRPVPEILLYDDGGWASILIQELKNLLFKVNRKATILMPDKNADVNTDDLADCLAGAVSAASNGLRAALPSPVAIQTGLF